MRKTLLFISLSIFLLSTTTKAQQITPNDVKNARNSVYLWIANYNIYSKCEGKNAKQNFNSLFTNPNIKIYNDYFAANDYDFDNPTISQDEYIKTIRNKNSYYEMRYDITNGRYDQERYMNGIIYFHVVFTKKVRFIERDNSRDDRYEYPPITLNMEATLEYNIKNKTIKASSLSCTKKTNEFVVFHNGNENTLETKYSIEKKTQQSSDPLIKKQLEYKKFDHKMAEFISDTLKNGFGLGYTIGFEYVNAPISNASFSNYSMKGGRMHSAQAMYYRQLYLNEKNRWGIDLELWLKESNYSAKADFDESYYCNDPDGGLYQRIISARNYEEHYTRKTIEMPIAIRYEYFINKNLCLFAKSGISFAFDIERNITASGDMDYRGYYHWLFDVTLSQNGIYDFGQFGLTGITDRPGSRQFSIGYFASTGLSYYFLSGWSTSLAFRYRGTIWGASIKDQEYHLSRYNGDWRSITYAQDKFNTRIFNFQLIVNYNF